MLKMYIYNKLELCYKTPIDNYQIINNLNVKKQFYKCAIKYYIRIQLICLLHII